MKKLSIILTAAFVCAVIVAATWTSNAGDLLPRTLYKVTGGWSTTPPSPTDPCAGGEFACRIEFDTQNYTNEQAANIADQEAAKSLENQVANGQFIPGTSIRIYFRSTNP